ncbi:MAG: glyoxylate/hydroxypyruvate reductase A [Gammaproteobacteria bacterium]|nr:glyoxylate/hydroxypyruvate reductase A [Gammaproteobacteria bacterium]MBU1442668.1 glyoxylate/hydroxypyruvate reductase A [Gammaproteobacteria bacterium]MBU2286439.1 glyoxylate/hydroxypyruvate reductase A [Gammaproteobacteria bacterium]
MRITVCLSDLGSDPWVAGLRAALPDAEVAAWAPGAAQADHAVVWAPPQAFLDEQPRLRGLFNIGAGVDALLKLRLPPEARIVRLDDAGMSVQMAEYVCHALIRHFREFDGYEADAREGRWGFRKPRRREDFGVGVMGLGALGERVAKAVAQFDFPVLGWSRTDRRVDGVRCFSGEAGFGEFLSATRVLVNLLPLTEATRGVIRRDTLCQLNGGRPGGYLINVARGAHLVESDLIPLLDSDQLAGATLDVFDQEPLDAAHPFWRHPKITVTPHASARTDRELSIAQIVGKIRAFERGEPVAGMVDMKRGY